MLMIVQGSNAQELMHRQMIGLISTWLTSPHIVGLAVGRVAHSTKQGGIPHFTAVMVIACDNPFIARTPNDGASIPTLQFVSDAPYAPAVFFRAEGANFPRRMLMDAIFLTPQAQEKIT